MVRFRDQEGNESKESFDLPMTTTIDELLEVLKASATIEEDTEYTFYYENQEVIDLLRNS